MMKEEGVTMAESNLARSSQTEQNPDHIENGNYATVRFNALRHGILSKHVVLPHEEMGEFDDLLSLLMDEYQPAGITGTHLVEELAGIIWQKRRILIAEGAKINKSIRTSLNNLNGSPSATVKNAVPTDPALSEAYVDFRDLTKASSEELAVMERETLERMYDLDKASEILCRNKKSAYAKALKILNPELRSWWQAELDDGDAEASVESLNDFVAELRSECRGKLAEIQHHEAIKNQVYGEGISSLIMENLSRYETHLDRKFERTLAMLIKLKEMRGKK